MIFIIIDLINSKLAHYHYYKYGISLTYKTTFVVTLQPSLRRRLSHKQDFKPNLKRYFKYKKSIPYL